jgi:hypothetical protein
MVYELWEPFPFRQDDVVVVKCFSYVLWAMKIVLTSWLQALAIVFYYVLPWLQYSHVSIAFYYVLSWLSYCLCVYYFLPATIIYYNIGGLTKHMCHLFWTDISHMFYTCEMWRSRIVSFWDNLGVGDKMWKVTGLLQAPHPAVADSRRATCRPSFSVSDWYQGCDHPLWWRVTLSYFGVVF